MLNLCYHLGELVLARRPGAHLQKSQTQFVYGCWLGRDSHTDEHIVGSKAGVFRTRTVRRLTEDRSWSAEAVADMEWTPWKTASNDARQTAKGCCWREKRTHLECATASSTQCIPRTTTETRGTGHQEHIRQTGNA